MSIIDLFRPKWKHSNPSVRGAAVSRLTDQAVLAGVARNDSNGSVRKAAVEKLTCQAVLAEVAKNDGDSSVRKAAIEKLTCQAVLAEVAKNDSSAWVRKAAVEKLTGQAVLAEVAKNDDNWQVRTAAVEKLTDQAVRAEVAKNDSEAWVRRVAVEKLTDQAARAEVAKNDSDAWVRRVAVEKLIDQAALAEVAKNDSEAWVRRVAVEELTDQAALAEVAKNGSHCDVRQDAVKKLTDQSALAEVAKSGSHRDVRQDAVSKLTDQAALAEVVKNHSDPGMCAAALRRLAEVSPAGATYTLELEFGVGEVWIQAARALLAGKAFHPANITQEVRMELVAGVVEPRETAVGPLRTILLDEGGWGDRRSKEPFPADWQQVVSLALATLGGIGSNQAVEAILDTLAQVAHTQGGEYVGMWKEPSDRFVLTAVRDALTAALSLKPNAISNEPLRRIQTLEDYTHEEFDLQRSSNDPEEAPYPCYAGTRIEFSFASVRDLATRVLASRGVTAPHDS